MERGILMLMKGPSPSPSKMEKGIREDEVCYNPYREKQF
jgi:hypothetical protein